MNRVDPRMKWSYLPARWFGRHAPLRPGRELCWMLLVLVSFACVAEARENRALAKWLQHASQGRRYEPADAATLARLENRFLRTLQMGLPAEEAMTAEWQSDGWQLETIVLGEEKLLVLNEATDLQRGWGCYVIRPQVASRLVLQMPHSFSDQKTREIGLSLFCEGSFVAACWNTVPRKMVDVAHEIDHPFSSFTRALITYQPDLCFVQLHGFDPSSRKTARNRAADLIISNGNDSPEAMVRKTSVLMESAFPFLQVRLFPSQIDELGATTNVQAELLRQKGSRQFIHFEMSRTMRARMANDGVLRQVFLKNLDDGVE